MNCPHCNEIVEDDYMFCPRCGKRVQRATRSTGYTNLDWMYFGGPEAFKEVYLEMSLMDNLDDILAYANKIRSAKTVYVMKLTYTRAGYRGDEKRTDFKLNPNISYISRKMRSCKDGEITVCKSLLSKTDLKTGALNSWVFESEPDCYRFAERLIKEEHLNHIGLVGK